MTTSSPTIADQVAAFQQQAAAHLPAEAVAAFTAEQAGLDTAGIPAGVAAPGTPMPDGDLLDAHGRPTSLAAVRAGHPAVVVFYRGAWCPYCNIALRDYQAELLPALTERGVALVAVSPQKPDGSLTTAETDELSFPVLSDPANRVAGALGIVTESTEGTRRAQAGLGVDVAAANADGTHALPMPTVVVVDADGTIRWIDVHPNYTTRTEVADVLAALG